MPTTGVEEQRGPVLFVAAAALVGEGPRLLLAQRPEGKPMAGLWELPGGKILPDETAVEALIRELREEIDIRVRPEDLQPMTSVSHEYSDFRLEMRIFACHAWEGCVRPREGQELAWVESPDIAGWPLLPADRVLVPVLQSLLAREFPRTSASDRAALPGRSGSG